MIKKFAITLQYVSFSIGILFGVLSCDKDFKNVGVNLVDNNVFSTDTLISNVVAYSKAIERNQTNRLEQYTLGVYRDDAFGLLESSFVTQLSLAETNPDFGTKAVIDSVVVTIPYKATNTGNETNEAGDIVPVFQLDSIRKKGEGKIQLNVYRLGTLLKSLADDDPTKAKKYYSDDSFLKSTPLYSGVFTPNEKDTIMFVKRYKYPDYPDLSSKVLYKTDTIKQKSSIPFIRIPFDNEEIKGVFQDLASNSEFASTSNFQFFFRGLYFEALEYSISESSMMFLDLPSKDTNAKMTIYYSNDVLKDEGENQDLNDNGINGESDVWVRTPQNFTFPFLGVRSNIYSRDISGSDFESYISDVDVTNGEEEIFIQGAAGAHGVIQLFGEDDNTNDLPDELEEIREKNWLINEARLTLYVESYSTNWIPERLYLYKIGNTDDDDEENDEDTQVKDVMTNLDGIGGNLVRNTEGLPEKYIFNITDYITEITRIDSELTLQNLGIKVFDPKDVPNLNLANDVIMDDFDTNPKGLVLKGNLPNSDDTRAKLEIFYTTKNN